MNFRAELTPKSFSKKISHADNLLLMGSCFTEQIGNKLIAHKFKVLDNPNGILFNPVSIAKAMTSYVAGEMLGDEDLFFQDERWGSWDHHTKFSKLTAEETLLGINTSLKTAAEFIRKTDWIILTLGSAFVYERPVEGQTNVVQVVANCHKVPNDKFTRRLLKPEEVVAVFKQMITIVKAVNPSVKFLFTISPVRHLREGFVDNNRSKAALIHAVHSLVDDENVFYFPSYELVIDDFKGLQVLC